MGNRHGQSTGMQVIDFASPALGRWCTQKKLEHWLHGAAVSNRWSRESNGDRVTATLECSFLVDAAICPNRRRLVAALGI